MVKKINLSKLIHKILIHKINNQKKNINKNIHLIKVK